MQPEYQYWITPLVAVASAFVGSTFGAYLNARYQEKGRLRAIRDAFAEVLLQEQQRAAEQERGKRIATHEDIDNVLRELGAVTRTQETIRANIENDLWHRQFKINKRVDAYIDFIACCTELRHDLVGLNIATQQFDAQTPQVAAEFAEKRDLRLLEDGAKPLSAAIKTVSEKLTRFNQCTAAVHIFGSDEVRGQSDTIETVPHIALDSNGARVGEAIRMLDHALGQFVRAIRTELNA